MPRKPIPEELLTEKQKRDRKYRQNNKKYAKKYGRYYYLKKLLADPNYNKKRKLREKELLAKKIKTNNKSVDKEKLSKKYG